MMNAESSLSDAELVNKTLTGDRSAFTLIIQRYEKKILRFISGKVPDRRAEDLLQETFLQAYRSLPGYFGKKSLFNWLAAIATHCCHDFWRKEYKNPSIPFSHLEKSDLLRLDNLAGDSDSPYIQDKEVLEILNHLLRMLSPTDRLVLNLTYLEGRSVGDAAELLGLSRANVKIRAFRARRNLRKQICQLLKTQEPDHDKKRKKQSKNRRH